MRLALALQCPVLMDERLGREVARRKGLTVMGRAGLLLARQTARTDPCVSADPRSVVEIPLVPVVVSRLRLCWSGLENLEAATIQTAREIA